MPSSNLVLLYLLLGLNIAVYVVLAIGIIRNRRNRLPKNPTVEDAFKYLEISLNRAFPNLPAGFTWNEVINKLKALNLELDWFEIESTFKKYEDYRYGGIQYKNANVDAILRLASSLPRGEETARVS
jgi:hypothetical protein